jgi:hypothetical protein
MCALGAVGGFVVAKSINSANAQELPANEMKFVEDLMGKGVVFMAMFHDTLPAEIVVYADKSGNLPEWVTCEYVKNSEVNVGSITFKDYTASRTLKEESCIR